MFPWQKEALEQTSLTAAILVVGDAGIGAGKFTLALAEKFSGVQKINDHPDILLVRPEKNIIRIRPDGKFKEPTIHDLIVFCALKPTTLTHRIALILEAEKMNRHAANALLKTLEEPEGKKIIILWAKSAQLLPATIVSRCRLVTAPRPDTKTASGGWRNPVLIKKQRPLPAPTVGG